MITVEVYAVFSDSNIKPDNSTVTQDIPPILKDEVENALNWVKTGMVTGDNRTTNCRSTKVLCYYKH